jgi:hypothetical protein
MFRAQRTQLSLKKHQSLFKWQYFEESATVIFDENYVSSKMISVLVVTILEAHHSQYF